MLTAVEEEGGGGGGGGGGEEGLKSHLVHIKNHFIFSRDFVS